MRLLIAVLTGFAIAQVANLFTTVYLHRVLAHRAATVHGSVALVSRALLWLATGIKPRQWAAVHRKHHAHTDAPEDPHSPAQLGWFRVQLTNAALYRRVAVAPDTVPRYAKDLRPDRLDRVLFDRAGLGLGLGTVGLCLVFAAFYGPLWGFVFGMVAAVSHMVIYLGLSGAVNGIGHHFGKRPHDNSATNLRWLALLTAGEGWHNNHHAAPTSARIGFGKRQTDFGWWFIATLRRLKLATVRIDEVVVRQPRPRTPVSVG
jgi:stearoyl-CoA desaturase (delta-9 desaturase)